MHLSVIVLYISNVPFDIQTSVLKSYKKSEWPYSFLHFICHNRFLGPSSLSELKKLNQQESDSLDKGQLNKIMPSHSNKLGGVGPVDNQPSPKAPFKKCDT